MPSWNIHTAHVERLLADHQASELGIDNENAFLFGNYVPDIYLGFMVADTTFRLDYCVTHLARPNTIPVPDADRFWDECIARRRPSDPAGLSLALGAWAHLVADRMYNYRFRLFCQTHDVPTGDELRIRKQADFKLFGDSLNTSIRVEGTPELIEAAFKFRQYSILADDVRRAIDVASDIMSAEAVEADADDYQLLGARWMSETFEACNKRLSSWLTAWNALESGNANCTAAGVRKFAGITSATPDDANWMPHSAAK